MNEPLSLKDALSRSVLVHDHATLQAAITRMGADIDRLLGGERAVFLTLMNGALVFAGSLALSIRTDLELDYVHATRYQGGTAGHELTWLRKPRVNLSGKTVLLADDILDEGRTLKAVREACLALGAARVLVAALCVKHHDRCVAGIEADFAGVEVPDAYVYGYGMDFYEQGRNLPAIYALRDEVVS